MALIEDDPTAIVDLCTLLHCVQSDLQIQGPRPETLKRLLELGIVADKYDCQTTVALTVGALLSRFIETNGVVQGCDSMHRLSTLAAAAYALRLRKHFRHFTRSMILNTLDDFSTVFELRSGDVLPFWVICKYPRCVSLPSDIEIYISLLLIDSLEVQRRGARVELTEDVFDLGSLHCPVHDFDDGCSQSQCHKLTENIAGFLTTRAYWPPNFDHHKIEPLLEGHEAYGEAKLDHHKFPCGTEDSEVVPRWEFKAVVRVVRNIATGLCLDCMVVENKGACTHQGE